jgi:hypothetical protein
MLFLTLSRISQASADDKLIPTFANARGVDKRGIGC